MRNWELGHHRSEKSQRTTGKNNGKELTGLLKVNMHTEPTEAADFCGQHRDNRRSTSQGSIYSEEIDTYNLVNSYSLYETAHKRRFETVRMTRVLVDFQLPMPPKADTSNGASVPSCCPFFWHTSQRIARFGCRDDMRKRRHRRGRRWTRWDFAPALSVGARPCLHRMFLRI